MPIALIPRHFPTWTDHNESDPGITLVQLFAFLTEAAIYQLDRIPERSLEHFAALVGVARRDGEAIVDTLRRAFEAVRARERAVLAGDFAALVLAELPEVARAYAVARPAAGEPVSRRGDHRGDRAAGRAGRPGAGTVSGAAGAGLRAARSSGG